MNTRIIFRCLTFAKRSHFRLYFIIFFFKSLHVVRIFLCMSVFQPFLHELRLVCQHSVPKRVFLGKFTTMEPFPVVRRCVVSDGIAWSLLIVVVLVVLQDAFHLFPGGASVKFEVYHQFLLYPSVEGLVHRVVRGLSCPRHRPDDVGVPNNLVVCHGSVYAALVGMQHGRPVVSSEQSYHVLQPADVLLPRPSSLGQPPAEHLFGEHVEVHGHLEVHVEHLECGHVRHDDLPWPVHGVSCGEDEVGVPVLDFPWPVVRLVTRFRFDADEVEALVGVVVAEVHSLIGPDVGRHTSVTVRGMGLMQFSLFSVSAYNHNLSDFACRGTKQILIKCRNL